MIQINPSFSDDRLPASKPRYEPGQIVRHKRYGYRGVIVAADSSCQADPAWYMANKTQPDRAQAWYHVLVDGTASSTYPAEENLILDSDPSPIRHPWLEKFFQAFEQGRYIRNDAVWPA